MLISDYDTNLNEIKKELRSDESFDIVERSLVICNHKATLFFVDGLLKDDITEKILEYFYKNVKEDNLTSADFFSRSSIPYVEVDVSKDIKEICTGILSGISALLIQGFDKVLMLDTRTYPQRQTSEPDTDKVLRGSRDGFVETLIFNTALIRRRIRDTSLTCKYFSVGTKSHTDIALMYMNDKVDKKLLKNLIDRIQNLKITSLTMNQQSLVEALYPKLWYNPFPKVKHTERPDTTASALFDGNIVILVDNSPSALILPTSIFDVLEEADDYYFPPVTGTYLKLARYFITIISVFITPLWLLALQNPDACPDVFKFVLLEDAQNIPVYWQLILMEIGIDGLRLASLNTPNALTTPLSIIGAIALSEFAVQSGWVCVESILYMALVTVATYSQPNYELGYSLKFSRVLLLTLTQLFNLWGFIVAFVIMTLFICTNKTLSGKSYIYPLIPFNYTAFIHKILRIRQKTKNVKK